MHQKRSWETLKTALPASSLIALPQRSPTRIKKGNKRVSACSLVMTAAGNALRSVIPERPPPALAGLFVFAFLAVIATFASLILVPGLVAFLRLL